MDTQLFAECVHRSIVTADVVPSSPILVTLKIETLRSYEDEKTIFYIVTAVRTSNLPQ
jgi:hypothetical protein